MAGEGQSGDDRTEAATQKHVEQARGRGNAPVSRETSAFVSLAATVAGVAYLLPTLLQDAVPYLRGFITRAGDGDLVGPAGLRFAATGTLKLIVPILGAAFVAGAGAVLLQTNFLLHLGALQPKMSRVSPVSGLKRIFGSNGAVELVRSVAKLSLATVIIWFFIRRDLPGLIFLPWQDVHAVMVFTFSLTLKILFAGLWVQGLIAVADLGWVRFKYARDLRMSKQAVRDEFKETDGNPQIKARIRRIRMIRARKRMMSKVPTATVVITNPTHYAVALAYDRVANPAPRIVAKGMDAVAARIREVAEANRVPVVANAPLARALYRLELDAEIPGEHYKAVAEIIAFVWRLRRHPGISAK